MAKRTRTVVGLAAAALVAGVHPSQAAERGHVRWESPVIGTAIEEAIERSQTFRALVATIDASDTYVFVTTGECGHGVRACFVNVVGSGSHRYMFVRVDPRKRDCELMASIGHELRHTIEVIEEPSIRSEAAKVLFYERTGRHGTARAYETIAAMDAGNAVRSEINAFNRHTRPR